MTTVDDLVRWLDAFAPPRLTEDWDNIGLLCGDPEAPVGRVMTCLTVTPTTAAEAIESDANLIVSHHPVLFRPVKRIVRRAVDPNGFLWDLARAGIAIYSPHTAFDNCNGGINDTLAERLGLSDIAPLRPTPAVPSFKIVVFTPESDRAAVLDAAFASGAGRIGDYRECSFGSDGTGTFFGEEAANPALGRKGRRESVSESRLEMVCPESSLTNVLAAIRHAHSYEEPAIDVYPLRGEPGGPGTGRVGRLPGGPERLADLAARVARLLDSPATQFAGDPDHPVGRLAIACGAGDDFLREASRQADALLTGEARFHRALEAESLGTGLVIAGHHATERIGVEALAARLSGPFPDLEVWPSRREHDPWRPAPGPRE